MSLDAGRFAAVRNRPGASQRAVWRPAASIAASLVVGMGVGAFVFHQSNPMVLKESGGLVAAGVLAKALSSQSANAVDSSGTVQVGLSFLAKSGDYCRTFALTSVQAPAGLACRQGGDWRIEVWTESAQSAAQTAAGQNYRTASSSLPPALMSAVAERIAGDPLDQAGEAAALRQNWRVAQPH